MFVVIICTISTGRVRRKYFHTWDKAYEYADWWRGHKDRGGRYRVEVTREPQLPDTLKVPATPQRAA